MPQPILFPIRRMPFQAARSGRQLPSPRLLAGFTPLPAVYLRIFGVTKDSTGAVLGGCNVQLFRTADDVYLGDTTSDATTGEYEFRQASLATTYYVVAYLAGSPDVAGTTVNTLVGTG